MNTKADEKKPDELRQLQEEIAALREDLARIAETVGSLAKERVAEGVRQAKEQAAEALAPEDLEAIRHIGEEGEALLKRLQEQQRRNPLGTLLAAAGVGFVLGRLLGGR